MASWIRSSDELALLVARLTGCRALALDTESDSLYHHVEKVCLIQLVAEGGEGFLIDPLAFDDLDALAPLLADPGIVKVFHGADYDVTTLKRDFGFSFAGVFDTMIAARFSGRTEYGLQAVARSELGVSLSKGSQKDDWSRRPLTRLQEEYALADVHHLIPLFMKLVTELRALGRLSWVLEECDAVAALGPATRKRDADSYQKIKGASDLGARSLAALRELHAWREGRAEATDIPPFKIVQNTVLLAVATKLPRTRAELEAMPEAARLGRFLPAVLDAVERGLAVPEEELPKMGRTSSWPALSGATRRVVDALKAWRTKEAARVGLDVSLVLPQRVIDRLIEAAPRTVEELAGVEGIRRWRVAAYGQVLVDLLAG